MYANPFPSVEQKLIFACRTKAVASLFKEIVGTSFSVYKRKEECRYQRREQEEIDPLDCGAAAAFVICVVEGHAALCHCVIFVSRVVCGS